jgi:hypothetical protein
MKSTIFGKKAQQTSILLGFLMLSSCAGMMEYRPYARNVKRKPGKAGVVALRLEHRKEDRVLAKSMMKENCDTKKVSILDEGEVVIGTITNSSNQSRKGGSTQVASLFGIPVTSSSADSQTSNSTTTQKKEWQMQYKCTL